MTRNGEPQIGGAFATERVHTSGGLRESGGPGAQDLYRGKSGVTSGNPMCEPVYVTGAEAGDTLQVDVLDLNTGHFGWTGGDASGGRQLTSFRPQY